MARWVQYLEVNGNNELCPIPESKDTVKIDGRLTLHNQANICHRGLHNKSGFLLVEGDKFTDKKVVLSYKVINASEYPLSAECYI